MINQSRDVDNITREQIITDISTVSGASAIEVDLMINQSRDTENLTRTQIIENGDIKWITFTGNATATVNSTLIAEAIIQQVELANTTTTYNYAWDLLNVTITYDDLGYSKVETYTYNDTSNKWYLNSTQTRRLT